MVDKNYLKENLRKKELHHAELNAILEKNYPPEDAKEIKRIIAEYYFNKLTESFDEQAQKEGWTEETYKGWANDHFRNSDQ